MDQPFALRFVFTFACIYFFGRAYPIARFAPKLLADHIVWLTVGTLLLTFTLLLYFKYMRSIVPLALALCLGLALEIAFLFDLVVLGGPEGTSINLSILYILGLCLSIAGLLHSSTRHYVHK